MTPKITSLLLIVLVIISSCKEDKKKDTNFRKKVDIEIKPELKLKKLKADMNILFSKYKTGFKTYNIPFKKQTLTTEDGTIIIFNPENYENQISKTDTVQLIFKNYLTKKDFVLNDLQTYSEKGLLISNGMFFIDFKHKGKSLKLKKNKNQIIQFPTKGNKEMFLYYKDRDASKWIKSEQKLIPKKEYYNTKQRVLQKNDTIISIEMDELEFEEETEVNEENVTNLNEKIKTNIKSNTKDIKKLKRTFYNIKLKSFGWKNSDIFYDFNNSTEIKLNLENDTIDIAVSYLVFQNINSVIKKYIEKGKSTKFTSIPINKNIKLITVYTNGDNIFYFEKVFKTAKKNIIPIKLNKISQNDFIKKMNEL